MDAAMICFFVCICFELFVLINYIKELTKINGFDHYERINRIISKLDEIIDKLDKIEKDRSN